MKPDTARPEIARMLRELAKLIMEALPRRVLANDVFLSWETTSALLLARIARQGETLALLIEHEHELDAEMVMRSLFEHLTLFAWLAIKPEDCSRAWKARDPDANTLWWMVTQNQLERSRVEEQGRLLGIMDDELRDALKEMKVRLKKIPSRGEFPSVEARCEEIDAHWGARLAGWSQAEPLAVGFPITFRGHYWTLYKRGSTSVHPDYSAIRRFVQPSSLSGYQRARLVPESADTQVDVFISTSVFLMGSALAVADSILGWSTYDKALHLLGRWDEVWAPGHLIDGVLQLLGEHEGRLFGPCDGGLISVEVTDGELAVVSATEDGLWTRLAHTMGKREWTLRVPTKEVTVGAGTTLEVGPAVMDCVTKLATVGDGEWTAEKPALWPDSAP